MASTPDSHAGGQGFKSRCRHTNFRPVWSPNPSPYPAWSQRMARVSLKKAKLGPKDCGFGCKKHKKMLHVRHDGVLVGVGHEVTHVGAFEVGIAVEDLFYHHYYFKLIIIEDRKCVKIMCRQQVRFTLSMSWWAPRLCPISWVWMKDIPVHLRDRIGFVKNDLCFFRFFATFVK